ncbi:BTAD domain-containing putative transcriptional regulator [Streptomyces olivaceus]
MGRTEKPITTPDRALGDLARWLRAQRASGCWSYAELAERAGCHATTLQRAASGRTVPSARAVRAYAQACGASLDVAMDLWTRARRSAHARQAGEPSTSGAVYADGVARFKTGLLELYTRAGRPTVRDMERRAGGWGRLPHSTAHRIVTGQTLPCDEQQLTGYLAACEVAPVDRPLWIDAWRRVTGNVERASDPATVRPAPPELPAPIKAPDRPPWSALRCSVLGPVRAWHDGLPLSTGSPQQHALLAALLLRDGRTATAGELIDAIWGDGPPVQALAALRTYASRLRKTLGPEALVAESGGYAIRREKVDLDLASAEQWWADAQKARGAGELGQSRALIRKALALWEGEPLAHVPGPYADTQRFRLEEWRLQLLEARLDLELELGCHLEVVSELTALTAAHPLRERLRELLMLALYRSGRQAEALAVYADTRRLLAEELGVDPQAGLSDLHQRILEADEELNAPPQPPAVHASRASRPPGHATRPIRAPAQLLASTADFTGRESDVDALVSFLAQAGRRPMTVAAISGMGGVGKTALAMHAAHAARPCFPDGQLYVDLSQTEPHDALARLLRDLGAEEWEIPTSLTERAALYRSLLADRRVLVLLDDARDAGQISPLIPGTKGCATLITSRARIADLPGTHLIDLEILSRQQGLALFTEIVGVQRVEREPDAAHRVVAACGLLPLAIRIAASRLAARRNWTVARLAERLADENSRLDELQAGDLAIRPALARSHARLTPEGDRALHILGAHTDTDLSLLAAAALLDHDPDTTEDLLEELVDAGLLTALGPGQYRLHSLVRLFARTCEP